MKKWIACVTFPLLGSCFTACYTPRYVYSPVAQNLPVFIQKGDSKIAINVSSNLAGQTVEQDFKIHGTDMQAAYAFTHHFAGEASFAHRTEKNSGDFNVGYSDSSVIRYNRDMTELGLGYFFASGEYRQLVFQVFGGVGFGKSVFTDNGHDRNNVYYQRFHRMSVTKLFIQPAFMVHGKNVFTASLTSRFSLVYFNHIHTDYTPAELDNYKLDSLNFRPRLFWEPSVINNFGFKKIPCLQVEIQVGMAFLVSRTFVDYRAFNFSVGIIADLLKLRKVKK